MKTTTLLFLLFFCSLSAFPQWRWQNPLPQGNSLTSVYFTDSMTGYAVSDAGTILKTVDGALTWTIYPGGSDQDFTSVFFTDTQTGYVAGSDGSGAIILKTSNAGETWNKVFSGQNYYLKSLFFVNSDTGYVVGPQGSVFKTCDGGESWTDLSIQYFYDLESVFFTNDTTGYTVGSAWGRIYKTTNGGLTWDTLSSGTGYPLKSVFFTSADTGYVCGMYGGIYKTVNAGSTWTIDTAGLGNHSGSDEFNSIYFTDARHGYIAGWGYGENYEDVNFFKTTDAGATWTAIPNGTHMPLSSLFFPDGENGFAVGGYGSLYKSTNAGNSWNPLSIGNTEIDLTAVSFPDAGTGYALGYKGILKTTNGGISWKALPNQPDDGGYITTCFTSTNTGYLTTVDGAIYKTINGGNSWTRLTSGTTLQLNSICFTDARTGFIAGGFPWNQNTGGIILKTTDAGITWTSTIVSYPLSAVFFPDSATGYAVGSGPIYSQKGIILKTTDGGATWNELPRKTTYPLYSVFFTDAYNGYVVGDGHEGFRTTDGGETWSFMQIPAYIVTWNALNSVCFPTHDRGFMVDQRGNIFKTLDGGINWTIDSSGTANSLNFVFFTDSITGYVAGSGGTILKTGHQGEPFLAITPPGRDVGSEAGSTDFRVTSNTHWYVISDSSWCTATTSGSGNDTIFVSFSENTFTHSRVDTIRVFYMQPPKIFTKVTVTQAGANGIENLRPEAFLVFPNPATDKIIIKENPNLPKDKTLVIYNLAGERVKNVLIRDQHQTEIDIRDLSRGVYMVKLQTDSGMEVRKLVVQ